MHVAGIIFIKAEKAMRLHVARDQEIAKEKTKRKRCSHSLSNFHIKKEHYTPVVNAHHLYVFLLW